MLWLKSRCSDLRSVWESHNEIRIYVVISEDDRTCGNFALCRAKKLFAVVPKSRNKAHTADLSRFVARNNG